MKKALRNLTPEEIAKRYPHIKLLVDRIEKSGIPPTQYLWSIMNSPDKPKKFNYQAFDFVIHQFFVPNSKYKSAVAKIDKLIQERTIKLCDSIEQSLTQEN